MKILIRKSTIISFIILLCSFALCAQRKLAPYEYPTDELVKVKVREWQDLKFGLFIHWGTYSQWGIVESWSLCPEDRSFTSVRPEEKSYFEYVQDYEDLQETFNPVKFNPEKWAKAAKNAGMKYLVFTTKHHDGFNMFDTQFSDYKATSKKCAFYSHPKSNITREVFNAFREEGFLTGAYYSITDWHHNDFWWDYFPPIDRHINYSPDKYPEKWDRFGDFVFNQLNELSQGLYGPLDIMWFDLCRISSEKSLDWERYKELIRKNQPGILMVARGIRGPYENYITPEQKVPENALSEPWETCMTMGDSWSYNPDDNFKSSSELVQTLVQVVSRGGNLLLNVGPGPDGEFHPIAYSRLQDIGNWMSVNSESIYGTHPIDPYVESNITFVQKDEFVYATYLPDKTEKLIPKYISLKSFQPEEDSEVYLLGHNTPLKWEKNGHGFIVSISEDIQENSANAYAWVLRFKKNS